MSAKLKIKVDLNDPATIRKKPDLYNPVVLSRFRLLKSIKRKILIFGAQLRIVAGYRPGTASREASGGQKGPKVPW